MAAVSNCYNSNYPVTNNKGKPAAQVAASASSLSEVQDFLETLIKLYEKAKGKIMEIGLTNSGTQSDESAEQQIANNPIWAQFYNGSSKSSLSGKDVMNFFSVVFTYMKDNADSASKIQIAQAVNILSKQQLAMEGTQEGELSLDQLQGQLAETQIKQEHKEHTLGIFFKIVIPIIIAVVVIATVIAGFFTGGAADAAIPEEIEGGIALESLAEGATEAASDEAGGIAETSVDAAVDAASGNAGDAGGAAGDVGDAADDPSINEEENAAKNNNEVRESSWKQVLKTAGKGLFKGATFASIPAAVDGVIPTQIEPALNNQYAAAENGEAANAAAQVTLSSAAVNNLQTEIQEDMQVEQNEQQIQESAYAIIQQVVQAIPNVDSIGAA